MTSTASSQPRRLARASAAVLSLGLAAAIAGCSGNASASSAPSTGASGSAKATASAAPSKAPAYGDVVGSGKEVKAADGGSYETIALPADSPLYKPQAGADVAAAGYSPADESTSQKFVVDYMVTQFFDSTALETGDQGFFSWLEQSGTRYYPGYLVDQIKANPTQGVIVLGDVGGSKTMPALIHDGKPREKTASMSITAAAPYSDAQGHNGIRYEVSYSAAYRVADRAAAAFAGSRSTPPLTADQWLSGPQAKPQVKDGKGENEYRASGSAELVVSKAPGGAWQLIGFKSDNNFDMSDFAKTGD